MERLVVAVFEANAEQPTLVHASTLSAGVVYGCKLVITRMRSVVLKSDVPLCIVLKCIGPPQSPSFKSSSAASSTVACFEAFESQGKQEGLKDDFFTVWNFHFCRGNVFSSSTSRRPGVMTVTLQGSTQPAEQQTKPRPL